MSTKRRVASRPRVALVTPPSTVDYGTNIAAVLDESMHVNSTRHDPTTHIRVASLTDADLVIVCGSTARVDDDRPWISQLERTVRTILDHDTPVLGVCFGHQLVANALGGTVESLPARSAGYRDITRTTHGATHPLFTGLSNRFTAFLWHRDHVTALPPDAVTLARNETGIQAFASRTHPAMGIQFHPEVDLMDARTLVTGHPQSRLPADTRDTLTEAAASRAARTKRLYENAVFCPNPPKTGS